MISAALAGKGTVRKSGTPEFGWVEIEILDASPLFDGATRPVHAFCSHFDEVHDLPEGFTVLARSSRCAVQAFRTDDAPVFAVQAHPEIGIDEGRRLREDFAPRFPEMLKHPLLGPPRDSGLCETIVRNFLAIR
jgi:GMP synthase (glutamine-hydrolysing)